MAASASLVFFFLAYENMQKRIEIDTFESAIKVNEYPGARQRFEWMKYHDPETESFPGAYAFFIFRQGTNVDGTLLEEYLPPTLVLERRETGWKIVHAHRSTDF